MIDGFIIDRVCSLYMNKRALEMMREDVKKNRKAYLRMGCVDADDTVQ